MEVTVKTVGKDFIILENNNTTEKIFWPNIEESSKLNTGEILHLELKRNTAEEKKSAPLSNSIKKHSDEKDPEAMRKLLEELIN